MAVAFVTGATGFIGSHLVRELLRRGYTVRCLVRTRSDLSVLRDLPVALYLGDVRDPKSLAAPLQGVDYVFHLAAELLATDRATFDEVNRQGTINVLAAAEQYAAGTLKRFLFVSSQAAAGPGADATPRDESAPARPVSWYGLSKRQAEDAVNAAAGRLPVTIVRPPSVYGERERDISQVYPLIERRLHPRLGWRTKYAVLVYVGDLVRGIAAAAESDRTLGQTYYLAHPDALTSGEVVRTIARAMDKPAGLMVPIPTLLVRLAAPLAELAHHLTGVRPKMTRDKAREVAQRFWVASPARARRDFDWQAEHSLLEGMRRTVRHFRAEQAALRTMPLERGPIRWLKFVLAGSLIGAAIETTAALAHFYRFDPAWASFGVALGGFGVVLGTLAHWSRARGDLFQFALGTAVVGAAELLNELGLSGGLVRWEFAPGFPLGITAGWLRVAVLATAGGFVVLLANALAREAYKARFGIR